MNHALYGGIGPHEGVGSVSPCSLRTPTNPFRLLALASLAVGLACCAPEGPAPDDARLAVDADTLDNAALAGTTSGTPADDRPNPAIDRLRAPITVAEGLQVVIADVPIPPNQSVDLHYHPGEEFVYVLEGSAVHAEPGQPDRVLRPGDASVIPRGTPHGDPEGGRAIVFRVLVEGQPDRVWLDDVP